MEYENLPIQVVQQSKIHSVENGLYSLLKNNILFLLVPITFCFTGLIINGFSVLSPAYFSMLFCVLLLLSVPHLTGKHLYSTAYIILVSGYLFLQFIINPSGDKKAGLFLIVSINSYWVFELFFNKISKNKLLKICQVYIKFNVLLYAIELMVRLHIAHFNIRLLFSPDFFIWRFYTLKEINIIGGADTNFIATHLISLYFLCLYLRKRHGVKCRKYNIVFSVFIFFTFCRSSWISTVLGHIVLATITKRDKSISLFRFYVLSILTIGALSFVLTYYVDDSFFTKIDIFQKTLGFINNAPMRDLFLGLGYLNSIQIIGYNVAHNLVSTLLMDTGIIGLASILIIWCIALYQSHFYALYLIFPMFIFALSFIQQMIPFFYALLVMITVLEEKREQ